MWTAKNRGRYDRSKCRYPSDLTDEEWTHVEPVIPQYCVRIVHFVLPRKVDGTRNCHNRTPSLSRVVGENVQGLSGRCTED